MRVFSGSLLYVCDACVRSLHARGRVVEEVLYDFDVLADDVTRAVDVEKDRKPYLIRPIHSPIGKDAVPEDDGKKGKRRSSPPWRGIDGFKRPPKRL